MKLKEVKTLVKDSRYVIIKIGASWCKPCKSEKFLGSYKKLKEQFKTKIKFVELDADSDQEILEDSMFSVESVPTIKLFKEGSLKKQYDGIDASEKILNYLSQ